MKTLYKYLWFDIPKAMRPNAAQILVLLALSLAFCEVAQTVGFLPFTVNIDITLSVMILSILGTSLLYKTSISGFSIVFILYLALNVYVTNPPAVFRSWERLFLFILLFATVGPMFENKASRFFRATCLNILLVINAALAIFSFFCYFAGINYFANFNNFVYGVGRFGGLYVHSMLLGPMAGLSSCFILWIFLRKRKTIVLVPFCLCVGALLFSASRAALLSTIIGCLVMPFISSKMTKAIKILIILGIAGTCTFPLWEDALSGIEQKNAGNEKLGQYGSRTQKFNARLDEFKKDEIFGIGFASIDPKTGDEFNTRTGQNEPGSSWLATLSMTGIIGFMFVAVLMLKAFFRAKNSSMAYGPLAASLLAWFAVHMLFEGYIYAAGGPLCFILWLSISVAFDLKYIRQTA